MKNTDEIVAGQPIGPYQVESLLGEGGMGRVYKAVGPGGGRVAIKVVKSNLASDSVFRRRFARETHMATKLSHRHLVPVLETGEHSGVPYMAQQFVSGGSLHDLIERQGALDVNEAVRICSEVAAGLDAVHAAGLVHRDLKPANILLDETGCVYVTDFGLAKDKDASVLTQPGQALGTMDYMSPEQIRGQEVSAVTDVYALGCVTYECLSGEPPFAERKGMQVLWAHLQDDPPDLAERSDGVSAELSWAVARGLEKDPCRRPPSATAYARMVQVAAKVVG